MQTPHYLVRLRLARLSATTTAFWLAVLLGIPASADIVNVSFGGSVDGSGSVNIVCDPGPRCLAGGSFSFSGTNTQQSTFSRSGAASGVGTSGRILTASGLTQQNTTFSSDSLDIDVLTKFVIGAIVGGEWAASATLHNVYNLSFALTTESSVHLVTDVSFGGFIDFLELNTPTGFLVLDHTSDQILTLPAGGYQFIFGDSGSAGGGPLGLNNPERDFITELNVDFTLVPEPRWMTIGLALLVLGGSTVMRRWA